MCIVKKKNSEVYREKKEGRCIGKERTHRYIGKRKKKRNVKVYSEKKECRDLREKEEHRGVQGKGRKTAEVYKEKK